LTTVSHPRRAGRFAPWFRCLHRPCCSGLSSCVSWPAVPVAQCTSGSASCPRAKSSIWPPRTTSQARPPLAGSSCASLRRPMVRVLLHLQSTDVTFIDGGSRCSRDCWVWWGWCFAVFAAQYGSVSLNVVLGSASQGPWRGTNQVCKSELNWPVACVDVHFRFASCVTMLSLCRLQRVHRHPVFGWHHLLGRCWRLLMQPLPCRCVLHTCCCL
jgi:hypothetical protein